MLQSKLAGVRSVFPTASVAFTWKLWFPVPNPFKVTGVVQSANAAPSTLHWNVLFFSVDLNLNVALLLAVGVFGFPVMLVSGGIASIVQMNLAAILSVLPAASMARTWNVCFALPKLLYTCGLVQEANALTSNLHSNVPPASVEVKSNLALVSFVTVGGCKVIVVFGRVLSIVQSKLAGVGSVWPAAVART